MAYTEGGRTKTLTLTDADVAEVAAALARYQGARAELERKPPPIPASPRCAPARARRGATEGGLRGQPGPGERDVFDESQ